MHGCHAAAVTGTIAGFLVRFLIFLCAKALANRQWCLALTVTTAGVLVRLFVF
jgi:hypothetical protein